MRSSNQARKTILRSAFSAAVLFAGGIAVLPLVTGAAQDPQPTPYSLKATFDPDHPVTNCCTGKIEYVPFNVYTNPPECIKCHTVPAPATWAEWKGPPAKYAGEPCLRFDF